MYPALFALALSVADLLFLYACFKETLPREKRVSWDGMKGKNTSTEKERKFMAASIRPRMFQVYSTYPVAFAFLVPCMHTPSRAFRLQGLGLQGVRTHGNSRVRGLRKQTSSMVTRWFVFRRRRWRRASAPAQRSSTRFLSSASQPSTTPRKQVRTQQQSNQRRNPFARELAKLP